MKKRNLVLIFILLLLGCSGIDNNPKVANQSISLPPQVVINNLELQKEVSIGIGSDRTNENNIMEAYVDVRSNVNHPVTLQYRFRWFDVEDFEVGKNMSMWTPLFLEPRDAIKVTGVAPTPKADNFKFYLKRGD